MPRPTPARIFYLLIGLVLGLIVTIGTQFWLIPALIADLPFGLGATPTPVVPAGPIQFTGANLERVLVAKAAQEKGGVTIRINSVELYRDGLSFTYSLTSARTGASPQVLEPETFQVSDDRGTAYAISPLGTASVPSAGLTTGIASFTPAPPPEARTIRILIPNALAIGLRPAAGQPRVAAGPWELSVALRS